MIRYYILKTRFLDVLYFKEYLWWENLQNFNKKFHNYRFIKIDGDMKIGWVANVGKELKILNLHPTALWHKVYQAQKDEHHQKATPRSGLMR